MHSWSRFKISSHFLSFSSLHCSTASPSSGRSNFKPELSWKSREISMNDQSMPTKELDGWSASWLELVNFVFEGPGIGFLILPASRCPSSVYPAMNGYLLLPVSWCPLSVYPAMNEYPLEQWGSIGLEERLVTLLHNAAANIKASLTRCSSTLLSSICQFFQRQPVLPGLTLSVSVRYYDEFRCWTASASLAIQCNV